MPDQTCHQLAMAAEPDLLGEEGYVSVAGTAARGTESEAAN